MPPKFSSNSNFRWAVSTTEMARSPLAPTASREPSGESAKYLGQRPTAMWPVTFLVSRSTTATSGGNFAFRHIDQRNGVGGLVGSQQPMLVAGQHQVDRGAIPGGHCLIRGGPQGAIDERRIGGKPQAEGQGASNASGGKGQES